MHCGGKELCYLAQTLCLLGRVKFGVIENSYFLWGVRKKMYQIKKTPPAIRDFMNERSLKLTKIFNLNFLKFDCQNLPFRRSLTTSN